MHQNHSNNVFDSFETDAFIGNHRLNNNSTEATDYSLNIPFEEGRTLHVDPNNLTEENCFTHGCQPTTSNTSFTVAPARSFAFRREFLKEMHEHELYNEPFYRNTWTSQTPSRAQSSLHRYNEHRPGNYSFQSHHSFVNNLFSRSHSQITHPHVIDRNTEMLEEDSCEHMTLRDAEYIKEMENLKAHNLSVRASASTPALVVPQAIRDGEEEDDQSTNTADNEETNLPEFAIESIEDEAISEWEPSEKWPNCFQHLVRLIHWYVTRLTGYDQSLNLYGFYPSWDQIVAFVFTCLTLVIIGLIEHYGFHPLINETLHIFIPAFGASSTVVFAVPKAPIAQPRAVFLSHIFAAFIGVCLANALHHIPNTLWGECAAGALGVGLHLALMQITNTLHPPASATVISAALTPLNEYYHDQGFLFVVTPVALGSIYVILMACLLNNIVIARSPYPQY